MSRKPIHLAAHFPGVNNTTVWTDPSAGSQIEFDSFTHLARTAERGLFDFFFLAEGLRLREHRGRIYDLDVVGRPDTFTVLAALAGVTERIGLTGTINTTFNEPFEVARQFATLDHLSGGRAGWNIVTSSDAFTGANFRRGGFLDHATGTCGPRSSSPCPPILGQLAGRRRAGRYRKRDVRRSRPDPQHRTLGLAVRCPGLATLPAGPQGHPVSAAGRRLRRRPRVRRPARRRLVHPALLTEDGQRYYADVKGRAASYGRDPDQLKVFPAATFVLGDTDAEAQDKARHIRYQQVSGATAIAMLEQVWGRDLSELRPGRPATRCRSGRRQRHHPGRVRHTDPAAVARRGGNG